MTTQYKTNGLPEYIQLKTFSWSTGRP